MNKIISILTLTLVISACRETNSESIGKTTDTRDSSTADISKPEQKIKELTKLDSIDKANNKSVIESGDNITKAVVFLKQGDSSIHLSANIRRDHRIFGYEKPDINSERLLLLSIFTNDVKNNPFGCKLGSYYDTGGMEDLRLEYLAQSGDFIEAVAIDKTNKATIIYFEKKWIEFD